VYKKMTNKSRQLETAPNLCYFNTSEPLNNHWDEAH
jgi:hypothetical protein